MLLKHVLLEVTIEKVSHKWRKEGSSLGGLRLMAVTKNEGKGSENAYTCFERHFGKYGSPE